MGCQSGYRFPYDSRTADFDDVFVRKEYFSEGGLWIWGDGAGGILGNNTRNVGQSSPVQTISGGTNWKQVSTDRSGSVPVAAGIKSDGTLWLWGCGTAGRLGVNISSASRSSPVQTVSGGTNWKQVAVSQFHTAAIKTDGTLWLWGCGTGGGLGTNSIVDQSSPVQTISAGTNWKQVSLGSHIAAIKTDGTLWLWGCNNCGQLGNNAVIDSSSPVQTVSGGTNWKEIAAHNQVTASIKTDGSLWVWGWENGGSLGTNTPSRAVSSPVQTAAGGNNWKQVSITTNAGGAIKTDGTLWLWGQSQFDGNTVLGVSSPIQQWSGGTNWKKVSVSGADLMAIKTDGTLWTVKGDLAGDNTITSRSSPVQTVSGGTNWKDVCKGSNQVIAIREDCW
jgi:rubredoxin